MKRIVIALLAVALAGCGSDATGPSGGSVTGTWNLRSVNGTNLPYSFPPQQGVTITVTGSVLTLSSDGAYNEIDSILLVGPGGAATTTHLEAGMWSATNGSITFDDQTDGVVYQGSVTGNALTEIVNGFAQVYAR
jgi:hypothetical protein